MDFALLFFAGFPVLRLTSSERCSPYFPSAGSGKITILQDLS